MNLTELANKHRTDKGTTFARGPLGPQGYTKFYEELLGGWRDREFRMLEIGVAEGGSLRMWREYFPKATIYGLDARPVPGIEGCKIVLADQKDRDALVAFPPLDLVIDDGSHEFEDQVVSFEYLFPAMPKDGVYVIEDLHAPFNKGETRRYFEAIDVIAGLKKIANAPDISFKCEGRIVVVRK